MERRQFLGTLTGPVAVVCAVCMGSCSKSGTSPSTVPNPGPPPPPPGSVNFTVDLNTNLTTIGSSLVQGAVIVVRLATGNTAGSFTAVQVACPHQGTAIAFNQATNNFVCPNHGSTFSTSGAVTQGPAASSLQKYTINISGSIMTVTG